MEKQTYFSRMDDLRRIVIPVEVKKALHLHDDDLLVFELQQDRSVVIRPYDKKIDYAKDLEDIAADLRYEMEENKESKITDAKLLGIIDLIITASRGVKDLYGYSEDN